MTPKEKAIELVEKMMLYSYEKIENENSTKYIVDNKIKKEHAIQCALIVVQEIIEVLCKNRMGDLYYRQVKQEIELL